MFVVFVVWLCCLKLFGFVWYLCVVDYMVIVIVFLWFNVLLLCMLYYCFYLGYDIDIVLLLFGI